MATGRTVNRWVRCYSNGYDLSGYSRMLGPLVVDYTIPDLTAAMSDGVQGTLPDHPNITPTMLKAVFDNTATTGLQAAMSTPAVRNVMIPVGIRAAPAQGDPVFAGAFEQLALQATNEGGAMYAEIPFGGWDVNSLISYQSPWGVLLHAKGAETAANSAVGIDDNGGASTKGGWMMYQIFTCNAAGTATITVQDAAVNNDGGFALLSGATSGAIAFGSIPTAGIVAIGVTADVRQYLRWQLALAGGMTTCTFALAFIRGKGI